jgi:uncharacterized membrane-anchored protein YitT (DUF2179 family)
MFFAFRITLDKRKGERMKKASDFLLINFGVLLVAVGVALFKVPNHFATGGVSGLAIIIQSVLPNLTVGMIMLVINIVLLLVGLKFASLDFGVKTIYSTVVLSVFTWLLEKLVPLKSSLSGDMMLDLIFAILFIAAGSAILFYLNASSGGTDIIARIINKKLHWHIGKALLAVDFAISLFAIYAFGFKIGMYSVLGVILKSFLIDEVVKGLHTSKQIVIISNKPEEIKSFIMNELKRGVTVYSAIGGHTNSEKQVLNTVMGTKQAIRLREFIMKTDSAAFIVVDNVNDIYGKGFKTFDL